MTPHKNSVDLIIIFATIVVVVPFYHNNVFVTSADTPPAGGHGGGVGGGIAESADIADVAGAAAAGKESHPPPLPVEGVAREAPPLNLDKITDSPVIASTKSAAAAVGAVSTEAIAADAAVEATTTTTTMDTSNDHNNNGTIPSVFGPNPLQNRGMIVRMTYVLVGFSILILVYFVVKAVRLRRMKSRTRKYGVLTENLNSPLGLDEDSEEEVEVFEVHGSNVRGGRATSKGGNTASDRLLP